jgi:hypothetical protein
MRKREGGEFLHKFNPELTFQLVSRAALARYKVNNTAVIRQGGGREGEDYHIWLNTPSNPCRPRQGLLCR